MSCLSSFSLVCSSAISMSINLSLKSIRNQNLRHHSNSDPVISQSICSPQWEDGNTDQTRMQHVS